jgi:hypothetical protein
MPYSSFNGGQSTPLTPRFQMTIAAPLPTTQQQADLLKKILPGAIKRTTVKLDNALLILTEGEDSNLDDFFGIGGNTTVDKTKFLAPIFNPSLASQAKEMGLDYIKEEAVGYDAKCLNGEVENKLSLGKDPAQFATGNNHSKSKVDKIFCVKLEQVGNIFPSGFACIVDLSKAQHPDTGFTDTVTKSGKNNHGFASLKVHVSDVDCITVIHGEIRTHVKGRPNSSTEYVQIDYADF